MGKGVVLMTTLIAWSGLNPHPGHVVASLDNTLYNDYLCLMTSNKQQIQLAKIQKNPHKHWIYGNSLAGAVSSNHEVVKAMKIVRIAQQFVSDAVRWQEDKYAQQQLHFSLIWFWFMTENRCDEFILFHTTENSNN